MILIRRKNILTSATSLRWFLCNIYLYASLDRFQVDIEIYGRQIELFKRQDSIQSYNNMFYDATSNINDNQMDQASFLNTKIAGNIFIFMHQSFVCPPTGNIKGL